MVLRMRMVAFSIRYNLIYLERGGYAVIFFYYFARDRNRNVPWKVFPRIRDYTSFV